MILANNRIAELFYFLALVGIFLLLLPYGIFKTLFDWVSLHVSHGGNAKSKERADWMAG